MRKIALISVFLSSFLALNACAAGDSGLTKVHADIVSDLPAVTHISLEKFTALDSDDILLLDIREPDEYAVSRLPGAIWVSPRLDAESALIQMGDVSGKHVIVYCSVGRRSSIFADRVQDDLLKMGATQVSNLEKGIFGWHNDAQPLTNKKGQTDLVHPYDNVWKRYVQRKDKAVFTPE